jgi:hypothetical protein
VNKNEYDQAAMEKNIATFDTNMILPISYTHQSKITGPNPPI